MSITTDWERYSSSDINREKSGPEPSKPEYLYAYTDPNATGTTLYAWTYDGDTNFSTIYTTDAIPTSASKLYDENMNDITGLITVGSLTGAQVANADTNTLTVGFTANAHTGGSN